MDLIDHYIREEADHVPLLLKCLKNQESKEKDECFSNLFNFKMDFLSDQVMIEDDCGVFSSNEEDRGQLSRVSELIQRLESK